MSLLTSDTFAALVRAGRSVALLPAADSVTDDGIAPLPVRCVDHCVIQLHDGGQLAARMWAPYLADAVVRRYGVLLEYLPYRKSDWTSRRDELRHTYFASRGFVCLRVDMRGAGDSAGSLRDEYAEQEQADGAEVVDTIGEQSWCNGRVALYGKSWGGFNGLQVRCGRCGEKKGCLGMGTQFVCPGCDVRCQSTCFLVRWVVTQCST